MKLLNYHSQLYYVEDRNEISDYEYDMLQQELKGLEEQFPQFVEATPLLSEWAARLFQYLRKFSIGFKWARCRTFSPLNR